MTLLLAAPPAVPLLPATCERRLALDTVVCADVMDYLRSLPDESVNCVVTSPPYWNLRDYGVEGQIGMEQTPAAFVGHLVEVFHEVKRVLRRDGVCWVNLGDSYANDTKWGGQTTGKHATGLQGTTFIGRNRTNTELPSKSLIGIPWRVAFALQDDGWYLRSDVIWAKPNPMPESVTDRPTKSHEYVFLLTKSERYWYDQEAIREPETASSRSRYQYEFKHLPKAWETEGATPISGGKTPPGMRQDLIGAGRNARTVWTIATEPTPFAHFATFPQKLVERCVLAGCPDRVCASCGAPWERVTEPTPEYAEVLQTARGKGDWYSRQGSNVKGNPLDQRATPQYVTTGWRPTCSCHAETRPGVALDPFMGSGTVGLVARRLGRHYIGCDLNPDYVNLANERLSVPFTPPLLSAPLDAPAPAAVQHALFEG